MAYKKHEWKARQGTGLNKFRDQNGNIYEFEAAPDEVTQPGTPFSAEWMNEMEEGIAAAGITSLVSTAPSGATTILITENAPDAIANNDNFRILFENEVGAGATLNLGNTGAYPIIDNYTGAAIVKGDIPADYIGDIMFEDGKFLLLNALRVSGTPTGSAFFTQDGTFTVPNFVTTIKVSACAAGVGRYAGEYLVDQIFNVTPGQIIELTVGSGNTVIGELSTLVAGTVASAFPTTKLGYAAGIDGNIPTDSANSNSADGSSGGSGSGKGAGRGGYRNGDNGVDSQMGKILYPGGITDASSGGGGSLYSSGGGGGATKVSTGYFPTASGYGYGGAFGFGGGAGGTSCSEKGGTPGGGGGAGGYGAGAGAGGDRKYSNNDITYVGTGTPSGGMVLIEWGGTVA